MEQENLTDEDIEYLLETYEEAEDFRSHEHEKIKTKAPYKRGGHNRCKKS